MKSDFKENHSSRKMSKLDDQITKYLKHLGEIEKKPNEELLRKVAKGLGPSIYNNDSSKVAISQPKEVETVKKNFLIKKLGLKDDAKLDKGIAAVKEKYNKRAKYRAVFYYLLTKQFRKSAVYD